MLDNLVYWLGTAPFWLLVLTVILAVLGAYEWIRLLDIVYPKVNNKHQNILDNELVTVIG